MEHICKLVIFFQAMILGDINEALSLPRHIALTVGVKTAPKIVDDIRYIQSLFGHAITKITEIYIHLSMMKRKELMDLWELL